MSRPTGFVYHEDCVQHEPGSGHPERPERIQVIRAALEASDLWAELDRLTPDEVPRSALEGVHSSAYLDRVVETCSRPPAYLDTGDTPVSAGSLRAADLAAGGALEAVRRVHAGTWKNAFSCLRPPGHHAEARAGMGFCIYNNVAVCARALVEELGYERVAVLDWDVHHGNGTQHIFEDDPRVFFASLHQYPYYPGTGAATERGRGDGLGATLNCPMEAGLGDREWIRTVEEQVLPALEDHRPQFVLLSAGFDAHADDPMAGMRLTEAGYVELTRLVLQAAQSLAGGKLVSLLEGGYDLPALARSAHAHVAELARA